MERVAFLLPATNKRVHCLLNPESLLVQRRAGLRSAHLAETPINDAQASDDPIIVTGGGQTALTLDLLFDIDLQKMQQDVHDVRQLSEPLWQLCETNAEQAPLVRLVWGKSWNVPGVISAGAQRFDRFLNNGTPQRNWMRLRFLRVSEQQAEQLNQPTLQLRPRLAQATPSKLRSENQHSDYISAERLDLVAAKQLGDPSRWREIAEYNDVEDPFAISENDILRLPQQAQAGYP